MDFQYISETEYKKSHKDTLFLFLWCLSCVFHSSKAVWSPEKHDLCHTNTCWRTDGGMSAACRLWSSRRTVASLPFLCVHITSPASAWLWTARGWSAQHRYRSAEDRPRSSSTDFHSELKQATKRFRCCVVGTVGRMWSGTPHWTENKETTYAFRSTVSCYTSTSHWNTYSTKPNNCSLPWGAMLNFQWPVWESESDNTKFNTPAPHSHLRPCKTYKSHDTGERKWLIGTNLGIFT